MKFTTSSKALSKALDSISAAVLTKTSMPILKCILFEKTPEGLLCLTASTLETTIVERLPVQFDEPVAGLPSRIAVPASYLSKTVRSLGDVPVTFEFSDRFALTIRTDYGKYKLMGHDGGDFPAVPLVEQQHRVTLAREVLLKAVDTTSFAVSKESVRSAMFGLCFQLGEEALHIVATDTHRLVMYKLTNVPCGSATQAVIPGSAFKGMSRLSGEDTCVLTVDKSHASFDFGSSCLTTRLIDAKFPIYQRVIPQDNERMLTVRRQPLWAAVQRAALFAGGSVGQIRLDIRKDSVKVSAEDIERAHAAHEVLNCDFTDAPDGSGEMVIAFNAEYLDGVLQHMPGEEVRFALGSPNRASMIYPTQMEEGVELMMLIMPVMLNQYV